MRKGKLLIIEKRTIKEKDVCFDTVTKKSVDIVKIDDTGILTWESNTHIHQPLIKSVGLQPDRFVNLRIEDEVTGETFPLDPLQHVYIYGNENRDHLKFFTAPAGAERIETAVVLSKDINMQHAMNKLAPVADLYGQYVASQKSINEPAKNFGEWYFLISI